jgi:serine protease Do
VSGALSAAPELAGALAEVAERLRRITTRLRSDGGGAGVIWRRGLVVTCAHVVGRRRLARVALADGRLVEAPVLASDPGRDLAALAVDTEGLPAAIHGDSAAARVGELVLGVGHPFGIGGALSLGVVHSTAAGRVRSLIMSDLRLAPGNSGGPLADADGRVVGINAMIADGLAVAVASLTVERFLSEAALSVASERP